MKIYNTRKDIPTKYKWDLEDLLKGQTPEWHLNKIKTIAKYLTTNKEKYVNSVKEFSNYLKKEEELTKVKFIYTNWLTNNVSVNIVDEDIRKLSEEFSFWEYNFSKEHANDVNFILKNEKVIQQYLKDDKFKTYRFGFQVLFSKKKHILSAKEEKLLSKVSRAFSDVENQFSILSNTELIYKPVKDSKGKYHKLTQGNYSNLMKNSDAVLRKNTYNEFWDRHLEHKESFATMLYEHKKAESTIADVRHYDSSVDMLTNSDFIDKSLLQNIYKIVSEKSILVRDFSKIWNKNYKMKFGQAPKIWDKSVELISIKTKYTVEQAQDVVLEALKPFGKEYTTMIKKAYKERWIDYMPVKNKRSGAYSIGGTYGIDKKYICMNFDGEFRSVETLAHELGHSMHSYYSDKNNDLVESQYEILVAEIASTFNELMLADHMLKKSKSNLEKIFIIEQLIVGVIGAIHRQALWSEYEFDLYKAIDKGEPVNTHSSQMEIYRKIINKYSGKKTPMKEFKSTHAASFYVPHYYYGFYVYKYVVGLAATYSFFNNYKKHGKKALDKYVRDFLSAGGKGKPIDRLKKAGVDLSDPKVILSAFEVFESYIKEYKRLSKLVF